MKHTTQTISASAAEVTVCNVQRGHERDTWFANVFITGTFNSQTVTLKASPDGGTTKVTLQDAFGQAATATADKVITLQLADGAKNSDHMIIYASVASGTGVTVSVTAFDNR